MVALISAASEPECASAWPRRHEDPSSRRHPHGEHTPIGAASMRREAPALPRRSQVLFRFAPQGGQAGVVVRELRQVGKCDLPGDDRIVPADVGLRVPGPCSSSTSSPMRNCSRSQPSASSTETSADEGLVRPGVDGWVTYAATAPGPQGMERGASMSSRPYRVMKVRHLPVITAMNRWPPLIDHRGAIGRGRHDHRGAVGPVSP